MRTIRAPVVSCFHLSSRAMRRENLMSTLEGGANRDPFGRDWLGDPGRRGQQRRPCGQRLPSLYLPASDAVRLSGGGDSTGPPERSGVSFDEPAFTWRWHVERKQPSARRRTDDTRQHADNRVVRLSELSGGRRGCGPPHDPSRLAFRCSPAPHSQANRLTKSSDEAVPGASKSSRHRLLGGVDGDGG